MYFGWVKHCLFLWVVHMWCLYVNMCMPICGDQRSTLGIFLRRFSPYLLREYPSINPELTSLARLAHQCTPPKINHLVCIPWLGYRHAPWHLIFTLLVGMLSPKGFLLLLVFFKELSQESYISSARKRNQNYKIQSREISKLVNRHKED